MPDDVKRDLGEQPIAGIMARLGLRPGDLVEKSTRQLSYKMVSRAVKGRRLTPRAQYKIRDALNRAAEANYALKDLFTY